jgi:G3E family GTPase
MDINCPCGSVVKKAQLHRHLKTKKHLYYLSLKKEDKTEEIKEEVAESKEEIPIDDNKSELSNDTDNDTDDDNQEVEELIIEAKDKKKITNKEHLDKIREKAHEVLKAKKMMRIQAKLDKENELLNKARLYDELLIKQKQDEEQKKQEELNRIEMEKEKRLKDYDKILEENMRLKNKANDRNHIQEYAKQQIIDDLKQQRLQYLSRHLGIHF